MLWSTGGLQSQDLQLKMVLLFFFFFFFLCQAVYTVFSPLVHSKVTCGLLRWLILHVLLHPWQLIWGINKSTSYCLQHMSLDWGREHLKHRENMQALCTQGGGGNRTTNPGGVRQASTIWRYQQIFKWSDLIAITIVFIYQQFPLPLFITSHPSLKGAMPIDHTSCESLKKSWKMSLKECEPS